jgi:hypothetical protein
MGNISDQIEYVYEDLDIEKIPKEQLERINKLYQVPIMELLTRWSKSQTYDLDNGTVLNDDYWDIPLFLRQALDVPKIKEINNSLKSVAEAIDALDAKLRNHRHDTTKQFSAKPEF